MKSYDEWKTTDPDDEDLGPGLSIHEICGSEIAQLMEQAREKDDEIARLKSELQIAYKAFSDSSVKSGYEQMHRTDVEEHNRLMHELADKDDEIARLKGVISLIDERIADRKSSASAWEEGFCDGLEHAKLWMQRAQDWKP